MATLPYATNIRTTRISSTDLGKRACRVVPVTRQSFDEKSMMDVKIAK